jgi:CubicO group peptidase (beta-lactamase class C family)
MHAVTDPVDPLADAVARLAAPEPVDDADPTAGGPPPPGVLVAVSCGRSTASGGRTDYATAGVSRRGAEHTQMTWSARTDAGSVTKILATTAALMTLVDAGELAVDDDAERYLPYLAGRGVSVRDLLEHRAGLWEWWPLYVSGALGPDAIAAAAALPPRYPVGAARHYSDLGFIMLGDLVARIAGEPLTDAVPRLALVPFGLTETRYATPVDGGPVLASSAGDAIEIRMIETGEPYPVAAHLRDFPSWRTHELVGEVNDGNAFHAFGGAAGHAGLFTTARDLLAFADGMMSALDGEGPVRAETARSFTTAGADPGQALGFRIWRDEAAAVDAIGHSGFPGVAFGVLPDVHASVAMITNRLHAPGVPDRFAPRGTEPMWRAARAAARKHMYQLEHRSRRPA